MMYQFKEIFYLLNQILQNKHCQPLFIFFWKVLMHVAMIIDQFMDALLIVDVWAKCGYNKVYIMAVSYTLEGWLSMTFIWQAAKEEIGKQQKKKGGEPREGIVRGVPLMIGSRWVTLFSFKLHSRLCLQSKEISPKRENTCRGRLLQTLLDFGT